MRSTLVTGIALFGALCALPMPAQQVAAPLEELDEVLIVGEQPGPGLWKVSKGDHVMWVLGSHAPLPRHMTWGSRQVEARIQESQEVLLPPNIHIRADIGLLRGLTLLPAAFKAAKIPGDRSLQDVLPPDIYARWRAQRLRYMPKDDDVEKVRPAIAIAQLRSAAVEKNELTRGVNVGAVVDRAAKKHKVRIRRLPTIERTIRVENPRAMLKSASQLDLPDLQCFTEGLLQLDEDVERMRAVANAWGRGDIPTLRSRHQERQLEDLCFYTLMTALNDTSTDAASKARKMLADAEWHAKQAGVQAERDWVAGAQAALARNRVTFSVLPLSAVLSTEGYLARLAGMGYLVEEPG